MTPHENLKFMKEFLKKFPGDNFKIKFRKILTEKNIIKETCKKFKQKYLKKNI